MEFKEFDSKYETLNLLGQGAFGKVYRVRAKEGKVLKQQKYYVAKKMQLQGLSEDELNFAFGQIQILQKINKEINASEIPSVVAYKEFYKTQHELIIIMEFCQSGDLTTFLRNLKAKNQRLEEKIITFWFIEMLQGLKALHSKKILHRDLKAANVFLTHDFHVKIGDFGISKILQKSTAITCIGSPLYLSPQVCSNQPYGLSSDIWSLACIIYELCNQNYPFKASNLIILAKMITCDQVAPIPQYYSRDLNEILAKMFIKDRKKRITLDQILKTPYIANAISEMKALKGKFQDLAKPVNKEVVQQPKIEDSFDDDDGTMKTISSIIANTSDKELEFSKKIASNETKKLNILQEAKNEKAKLDTNTGPFAKTIADKKSIKNVSKTQSDIKFENDCEMNKMQTINIKMLSNQIKSLTIIENEEDFQEVSLPQLKPTLVKGIKIAKGTLKKQKQTVKQKVSNKKIESNDLQCYQNDFEEYCQ